MKNFCTILIILLNLQAFAQLPDLDSLAALATAAEGEKKVMLYSDISYYAGFNDTDMAVDYAAKCIDAALKTGDSLLIAEGYNAMAIALYMKGDYESSLAYNLDALKIREKHGDAYSLLSSYSKIGNCLHELGRYDEAISYYLKSMEISEEHGFTQQTGLLSNNIAEIFKQQENYRKAGEYYAVSIDIATRLNDTLGLCKALINQGVAFKQQNMYDAALYSYNQAYDLIKGDGLYEVEGGLLINFGGLYKAMGQPEKSIPFYTEAEKLYMQSGEWHGLSIVYSNLGNTWLEQGDAGKAFDYYRKGMDLAEKTGSLTRQINAYEGMTNYYSTTGNYRQAYRYDSIADALSDSVFSAEKARIIEELNTQYQTEKKEKLLAEQKALTTEQSLKVQRRNAQLFGAAGVLVLLILLSVYIYSNQQNRHKMLRQQLALQKAEALNKIQEEKLRISRDLHDNIGSQLTFMVSTLDNLKYISGEAKRKERLDRLQTFMRDTMAQLRETIWALNSESISLEQLGSKMAEFIRHAKMAYPEINFRIDNRANGKTLQAGEAVNIFRTLQEAVNNALKYADAKNIRLTISDESISVYDDGKGFEPERAGNGNGLRNMEKRMEEAGFKTVIRSTPGKGTEVSVLLG